MIMMAVERPAALRQQDRFRAIGQVEDRRCSCRWRRFSLSRAGDLGCCDDGSIANTTDFIVLNARVRIFSICGKSGLLHRSDRSSNSLQCFAASSS